MLFGLISDVYLWCNMIDYFTFFCQYVYYDFYVPEILKILIGGNVVV